MDWCSTAKLKLMLLTVVLLMSTDIICLHGSIITGVDNLQCVNDYLSTINCTLRITQTANSSDTNSSYWLIFSKVILEKIDEDYFCSVKISYPMDDDDDDSDYVEVFGDIETFQISFCHNQNNGSEPCKTMVRRYKPSTNIKPNTPCCLTVSHNSSQHNFTWKSTYEEYAEFTNLVDNFKFQLHFFKRGDKHNSDKEVMSRDIYIDQTNYSVDDPIFAPDTEYIARVRSSPNLAFYKGQWSDWSPEVHWKTESAMSDQRTNTFISRMVKVFIHICVIVPLVSLLCYISVKKFRRSDFIPTPAPYFHTLYSECQGDFRSWVITHENTADMQKEESSLQIETLTKYADVLEEDHQPRFNQQLVLCSPYSNMIDRVHDTSLPGVPYAVSTMASHSAPENSVMSLTPSSQPLSLATVDSGCWLFCDTSLGKDSPWYCNEYCTLSTFQQTSPVTAEHHWRLSTNSCPQQIISVDAIEET
ncbi:interleukin-21 receptor isoform X2 [Echeneis naucrates]|uniref:interleukin-21 receptor isoform X2 n=1 Tax=Echeneis naucrates TaxID=173247 RepID=UPI001113896E|nr:interleukin-21 receptor-like isoform X2 [Echeneis naucrates]